METSQSIESKSEKTDVIKSSSIIESKEESKVESKAEIAKDSEQDKDMEGSGFVDISMSTTVAEANKKEDIPEIKENYIEKKADKIKVQPKL